MEKAHGILELPDGMSFPDILPIVRPVDCSVFMSDICSAIAVLRARISSRYLADILGKLKLTENVPLVSRAHEESADARGRYTDFSVVVPWGKKESESVQTAVRQHFQPENILHLDTIPASCHFTVETQRISKAAANVFLAVKNLLWENGILLTWDTPHNKLPRVNPKHPFPIPDHVISPQKSTTLSW